MTRQQCQTCHWWQQNHTTYQEEETSYCRVAPPRNEDPPFPVTKRTDFCGSWFPIGTPPPDGPEGNMTTVIKGAAGSAIGGGVLALGVAIAERLLQSESAPRSEYFKEMKNLAASKEAGDGKLGDTMNDTDRRFLQLAYEEALAGYNEGGCPIGSVLADGEKLIAQGRNQRVQKGDPIAHGEMDCLRKAGRQKSYRSMTLYTSLSPCMMCTGTILQFGIPRVVIGENTTFGGNEALLRERGVEVLIADDANCIELMTKFIEEKPELWNEDIAEE